MRKKVISKPPPAVAEPKRTERVRKLRVDAERNRELLVSAGKAAFTKRGANASLEEIARCAGVGIGTLYRHFPNRNSIIEAVYRLEVEKLANGAKELAELSDSAKALHQWMRLFIEYVATKKVLATALCSTLPGASDLAASSGACILEALTLLVGRAVRSGAIRSDIIPADLLRALAGFTYAGMGPDWEPSARRLIDLLMDGLRTHEYRNKSTETSGDGRKHECLVVID